MGGESGRPRRASMALLRIGIGVLLMVHGFAHGYGTSEWKADQPARSWLGVGCIWQGWGRCW
jgi:hypothetical protein